MNETEELEKLLKIKLKEVVKKVHLIYGNVVNESIKIAQKMKTYENKNIEELKNLFSENWIRRAKERLGLIKKTIWGCTNS